MKSNLAILTVNYNNYEVTRDFITSIRNINKDIHIYVADLSSPIKEIQGENIIVIPTENKGYAFGINTGLRKAIQDGYSQFIAINNDTLVSPTFLEHTQKSINEHPASIIGGKIYYAKGYEYHKDRYAQKDTGKVLWYAGGILDWKNVYTTHKGVDEVDKGQYDSFDKTDFVTGCLMIFDNKVVDKIGYWDESYFLYYEDADYCERAKQNRIPLFYDPEIVIWHKNAQSTGGSGSSLHQKYQEQNRVKFGLKYAPWRTKIHLVKNIILKPQTSNLKPQ